MADVGGLGQLDLILNLGFLFLLNRPPKQKKKSLLFKNLSRVPPTPTKETGNGEFLCLGPARLTVVSQLFAWQSEPDTDLTNERTNNKKRG